MTTGPDTTPAPQPPVPEGAPAPVPGAVPPQPGAPAAEGLPPQAWVPGPPLPEAPVRRSRPKALRVAVPIAVAVVVGVLRFTGVWGGAGAPQVGDCVHTTGSSGTSFDVVDCSSKDAQYKVVGVDPKQVTSKEFQADDSLCSSVPETEVVLWSGSDPDPGSVYCAAPVGSAG